MGKREPVTEQPKQPPNSRRIEDDELRHKWAVRTHDELEKRCKKLDTDDLIEEFLPSRSLAVAIGDSGLGKSPLCYQMALCIAAGKPFLDRQVRQGRVLYLDYENGLDQVRGMVSSLGQYLGLEQIPDDLLLWNFNDSDSAGSESERLAMIRDFKPALAIVDSLTGFAPEIEDRNRIATIWYQEFRKVIRDVGTTILGVHNLRKPSDHPKSKPDPLETANLRRWFDQARGPRVLINGSDIRLGVDEPHSQGLPRDEIALVLRGFARVSGELPVYYLARDRDEDGEPLGYRRLRAAGLLPTNQREAFENLPEVFRFKKAREIYRKGDQATLDFLNKCISLGLLTHKPRGPYLKVSGDPETPE